jgi:hypothetical protein
MSQEERDMEDKKIVIKFKDGSIMKGQTTDFRPERQFFYLELVERGTKKIDIEDLKAIFFVKDFTGKKEHKKIYKDVMPWGGQKVKVEFIDGEMITGYTASFSTGIYGFFITPADSKGNNEEIFVIKSATKSIAFL